MLRSICQLRIPAGLINLMCKLEMTGWISLNVCWVWVWACPCTKGIVSECHVNAKISGEIPVTRIFYTTGATLMGLFCWMAENVNRTKVIHLPESITSTSHGKLSFDLL